MPKVEQVTTDLQNAAQLLKVNSFSKDGRNLLINGSRGIDTTYYKYLLHMFLGAYLNWIFDSYWAGNISQCNRMSSISKIKFYPNVSIFLLTFLLATETEQVYNKGMLVCPWDL